MTKSSIKLDKIPLTTKELREKGISESKIKALVKSDDLHRRSRGIYQNATVDFDDENQFKTATKLISGLSAIGLISALSFYNLTDEIPKQTWLIVEANKRTIRKDIRLFRCLKPYWNIGIINSSGYRITTLERTIVDLMIHQSKFGNLGHQALKKAIQSKKTTLSKIIDMAESLGVGHRISPYIQALL
jgi:predicted transcriptional regulator of viral defense system